MIAQPLSTDPVQPVPIAARAWGLLAGRLCLVLAVSVLMWLFLGATAGMSAFPPTTMWATLGLLPVNIICLIILVKLYRSQGLNLREAMGIRYERLGKDIGWGVLWLMVLNVPFVLAVTGTVWIMYGAQAPQAFATIFISADAQATMSPVTLLIIGLIAVLPFILINAPVEELVFRGYGLTGLQSGLGRVGAILMSSLLFGAQHIIFAPTIPGMIVYFVAFTVWGATAAVIVIKQGRLFPVIIAHWIINFMLSAPALVLPVLLLTGVVEQP